MCEVDGLRIARIQRNVNIQFRCCSVTKIVHQARDCRLSGVVVGTICHEPGDERHARYEVDPRSNTPCEDFDVGAYRWPLRSQLARVQRML